MIKELTEEFEKSIACFGENTENYITFKVLIEKGLIKMEKKLQKIHLTYYNVLIVQDLWQAQYQILLIIFLKEFIKLNVNTDTRIKNLRLSELNINIATVFLNTKTLKMI